jgi:DNA-binding LacI/PurR family transcriptional regulator
MAIATRTAPIEYRTVFSVARRNRSSLSSWPHLVDADPALLWAAITRREVTAAFAFNDATASWVQKEFRNLNLSVPRDLSLISVDNMPCADFFDAPLTTFALPGEQIGEEAARLILRRLAGEAFPPQRVLLPARLIHRRSTAAPPRPVELLGRQPLPRAAGLT